MFKVGDRYTSFIYKNTDIIDATLMGWLTSILELGAWFGTLTAGFVAEIVSRKKAIILETAIFILGVVIQTTAVSSSGPRSILAGRFITGIGVGSLSMIVPMVSCLRAFRWACADF
jgi:MFS family permease